MVKTIKFQSPIGMHDILMEDQMYFKKIYEFAENMASFYGFSKIDTPILEDTELFSKGTGNSTDVVQKQMYNLKTKGGDLLTLRPEGTPSIVRAYIENGMTNMPQPIKLWYCGPFFRYEKPQAGRYRQFFQIGFETLGEDSSVSDVQTIQIVYNLLKELKLKNLVIEVNSIGDSQCKPYYRKVFLNYLKSRSSSLCGDCKRRLKENPLRILDCKEEKCQKIISQAPQIIDHLCDDCRKHFKEVLEFLDEMELPYRLNPHLVRGLDYYTKTVFEIFSEESKKDESIVSKKALGGGGRYDGLVKLLGGRDTPACGAAIGVDRIIELMKEKKTLEEKDVEYSVFIAQLGNLAKRKSLKLMEEFRRSKIKVSESFGRDSLKAQLRMADKVGAKYSLILGQKEALEGSIIIRDMKTGKQDTIRLEKTVEAIKSRLKSD